MELSCLPVSIFQEIIDGNITMREWAAQGKSMGLDAVDLSILFFPNHTPSYLEKTAAIFREEGIGIAMITTYPNFTIPDETQREREFDYCVRDIALASQLGARYLRITAGQRYENTKIEDVAKSVADYFLRCEEKADQYGVKLVYENHGRPGAWNDFDFTYDPEAFLALSRFLAGSNVRVNFDTANTVAFGVDPLPVFEEIFPQLETIHVADTISYGTFKHVEIGSGAAPIDEIFQLAKVKGFDGLVAIEEGSGKGLQGIREAVHTVRRMWG